MTKLNSHYASVHSALNLLDIDLSQYPLVQCTEYIDVVLCPGDMLFIPRWWWHWVAAVDQATAEQLISNIRRGNNFSVHEDNTIETSVAVTNTSEPAAVESHINATATLASLPNPGNLCGVTVAPNDCHPTESTHSCSVSFWWGKRILKN